VADEHVLDEIAAYALESLDASEHARVGAHVRACDDCARHLDDYRGVVGTLPLALDPVAPPPEAWPRLLAAAREARRRRRARAILRAARWPAVAALVASLVVWNVTLHRELARRAPGPAPGPEVEALSRRPGRIIILAGAGAPRASARIFVAVDGGGHLAISGLPPLPRGRTYQLWFLRDVAPPVAAATFTVDATGRAWAKVTVPPTFDDVRATVVTEEAAGGTAAPTGPPLLEAATGR